MIFGCLLGQGKGTQLTVAPDGHSAHAYVSDRNNIEK